uniref:Uncharacterized protein n=1 Tax=Ciona savignyi TaxID=51511 RepID=H2YCI5_CIOSA
MEEIKVRYSNFGDVSSDVEEVEELGNPLSRELGLDTFPSGTTAHYCLMRPRGQKKENVESPKGESVKRKQRHRMSSQERCCVALLQNRVMKIVGDIRSEKNSGIFEKERPVTVSGETFRRGSAASSRPTTHLSLLRHKPRDKVSTTESILLKKVISEILKRKLKEELKKDRPSTPLSRKANTSQNSQVTGDTAKYLDLVKKRIKEKISDVISDNVSSSGDITRDVIKRGHGKEERPRVMLFSVGGSSRGNTADWIIKQKFEKYRK